MSNNRKWFQDDAQVFWGEIAPSDHVVQIYDEDEAFLNVLGGFVIGGIRLGETVIVVATPAHISALNERIRFYGFDPFELKVRNKYLPLDAQETLSRFMVGGWPQEKLFFQTVQEILAKGKSNGCQLRVFGEMVALLWSQGMTGATVHLEQLWNKFCSTETFSLFCAYPKSGFTESPESSMMHICGTHSRVITGAGDDSNDILYRSA